MRYKVGDKVVIVKGLSFDCWDLEARNQLGKTRTIKKIDGKGYRLEETRYIWWESDIDHEATDKLNTLPQPHKSMLRNEMKVVHRDGRVRYILVETNTFHNKDGEVATMFDSFDDKLIARIKTYDIMQIWDGDTLIAQRTEKSEAELKKESLEKQMADLQQKVNEIAKEIKSL